jgi:hypothetical protein
MLNEALVACGVDPKQVDVTWDDLCQEEVLTFEDPSFPDAVLENLAEFNLTFPSRFVFANDELQAAFERLVSQSPKMLALKADLDRQYGEHLDVVGLSAFRSFDPEIETVEEFARRVEDACGLNGGWLIPMGNSGLALRPPLPDDVNFDDLKTLLALMEVSAPGIKLWVRGESVG